MILEKDFEFDAAHFLPNVPITHKCRRLHGHRYHITVAIKGEVDTLHGWVMDFGDVKKAVKPLIQKLDHNFLNAIPGLENPTAEVIAKYIFNALKKDLPNLYSITVRETPTSRCVYYG
ncbi:MAG: 6-carboxytetrahydropterin synthase QueD [Candidatus Hydrogenedentota bacterium]|nr:MAG: 6-carboxytetrahydropterin synthase QueD [Candidatus Hydrogenedentota bacterium]